MISEVKNYLDRDLIDLLERYYLFEHAHFYSHSSKDDNTGNYFFASDVTKDKLTHYVAYKLQKQFDIKGFKRIYFNLQFNGMSGAWHKDDGHKTYMLMITKTLKKDSGCFEVKVGSEIKSFPFERNKLIIFESNLFHRGLAPLEPGQPRMTLAFKTI